MSPSARAEYVGPANYRGRSPHATPSNAVDEPKGQSAAALTAIAAQSMLEERQGGALRPALLGLVQVDDDAVYAELPGQVTLSDNRPWHSSALGEVYEALPETHSILIHARLAAQCRRYKGARELEKQRLWSEVAAIPDTRRTALAAWQATEHERRAKHSEAVNKAINAGKEPPTFIPGEPPDPSMPERLVFNVMYLGARYRAKMLEYGLPDANDVARADARAPYDACELEIKDLDWLIEAAGAVMHAKLRAIADDVAQLESTATQPQTEFIDLTLPRAAAQRIACAVTVSYSQLVYDRALSNMAQRLDIE